MVMDRAYEGDETRQLVLDMMLDAVVPPKKNRLNPWEYDRELYKKRNEVERLFRRLKGFRRIFSRFEKLDLMFIAFIHIALIFDPLIYRIVVEITQTEPLEKLVWRLRKDPDETRQTTDNGTKDPHSSPS